MASRHLCVEQHEHQNFHFLDAITIRIDNKLDFNNKFTVYFPFFSNYKWQI